MSEPEKITRALAIKRYFEKADDIAADGGRKVEIRELKALTQDDKIELAPLAASELGCVLR